MIANCIVFPLINTYLKAQSRKKQYEIRILKKDWKEIYILYKTEQKISK